MTTEYYNRTKVLFYSSLDDLPPDRFHWFNNYILLDANVGSGVESILSQNTTADGLLQKGKIQEARRVLSNMRQAIMFTLNNVDPKCAAFAALVVSVDGAPFNDLSKESVDSLIKKLSQRGLTYKHLCNSVEKAWKNLKRQFAVTFPLRAATIEARTFMSKRKDLALLQLKDIIEGTNSKEELQRIHDFLLDMYKPEIYWGPDGADLKFVRSYDQVKAVVSQHIHTPIKDMSTREFYNALDVLQKQFEDAKKK